MIPAFLWRTLKMKAIALVSGGLDSILAAALIKEQGIEAIALAFKTPFTALKKNPVYRDTQIKEMDISAEFLEMMQKPCYGFGSNMNPCIDCKILMLAKARDYMRQCKAEFVVTGEVLGQRPMSQHKHALLNIAKKSGLEGLLLRPLSAKLLPETIPEKEGWVKRDNLLAFSGRGRKPQMELARKFGIKDYAQPAGGCLLTDPEFSRRLRDLYSHSRAGLDDVELLKVGRHFRLAEQAKLIVGRNQRENERLAELAKEGDYLFFPGEELAGPTSLGRGNFNGELIRFSCEITLRYCDLNSHRQAGIIYKRPGREKQEVLQAGPAEDSRLVKIKI